MLIEVVLTFVIGILLWKFFLEKPGNYPPGPWGLPVFGCLPLRIGLFKNHIEDLHRKYGNVVSWRIGSKLLVFISDYKLVKEHFSSNVFIDRADLVPFRAFCDDNYGVVGSNGLLWQNNRRFSLRHLRDLGMGKSRVVTAIHLEAELLIEDLKKNAGKLTELPVISLNLATLNIIWQLVASRRYSKDDPSFKEIEGIARDFEETMAYNFILDFLPWLRWLPTSLLNLITKEDKKEDLRSKFLKYMEDVIDEHNKNLPESPSNYIEAYLLEMQQEKDNPNSTMSYKDLTICLVDLFNAGSETTSSVLLWHLLYLATYPQVQEKLQEEIDLVLPKGTLATLTDKQRLPYTECFIHEVHRHVTLATLGALHTAIEDTKLEGHLIPKGAIVTSLFSFCHKDPRYWENPEEFNPDRFLNSEGKFSQPKEGFLPFGVGKRQCLGEGLARVELLIFLTAIVQNVSVLPPPGTKVDLEPIPYMPILNLPNIEQKILLKIR